MNINEDYVAEEVVEVVCEKCGMVDHINLRKLQESDMTLESLDCQKCHTKFKKTSVMLLGQKLYLKFLQKIQKPLDFGRGVLQFVFNGRGINPNNTKHQGLS